MAALSPFSLSNHNIIVVLKVATLKKTRHENLVLFMGACMTPPKLAIVTRSVGHLCHL